METTRFWAMVPAAGIGKRFGSDVPKQYQLLCGKPVIAHSISCFTTHPLIYKTIVVVASGDTHWPSIQNTFPPEKIIVAIGSKERYLSVYQGLLAMKDAELDDWVLVHDAVRPCLQRESLDRLISHVQHHPVGGLLGVRVRDTLKRVDEKGCVVETIDRENIWRAQTPQMFRYGLLLDALKLAIDQRQHLTDEASAIEMLGKQPLIVEDSEANLKITYPEDLQRAELFLSTMEY